MSCIGLTEKGVCVADFSAFRQEEVLENYSKMTVMLRCNGSTDQINKHMLD